MDARDVAGAHLSKDRDLVRGDVFVERYEIVGELGRGAYGVVYKALDQTSREHVALKIMRPNRISLSSNRWREATALRRLFLPGVAQLLGQGYDDDRPFVVMELIDGEPFPGPREGATWEELRPLVVRILEILNLVHAEGVVHGDLKPSNVLRSGSEVFLLDFGLATKTTASDYESGETGKGTPVYMAPELFAEGRPSAQSDLFAVGTMVFEALARQPFFPSASLLQWIRKLTVEGPPRLRDVLPDAPEDACTLVDALLARERADRPRSAGEALLLLQGESLTDGLPWLGDETRFQPIVQAMVDGTSLDVTGERGLGGERAIREAARHAEARGVEVHEIPPGSHPFESLIRMESLDLTLPVGAPLELLRSEAVDALRGALEAGIGLFAVREVDDWSDEVLNELRSAGSIVRRRYEAGEESSYELKPYTREELETFFVGIEIGFHLRTKPAKILYERTFGWPEDVFAELNSWNNSGFVHIDRDGVRTSVRSLQTLENGARPRPPVKAESLDDDDAELLAWIRLGSPLRIELIERVASVDNFHERLEALAARRLIHIHEGRIWRIRDVEVPLSHDANWLGSARSRLLAEAESPRLRFELSLGLDNDAQLLQAGLAEAERLQQLGDQSGCHATYRATVTRLMSLRSDLARDAVVHWGRFTAMTNSTDYIEETLWAWGDHDLRLRRLLELIRLTLSQPRLAYIQDFEDLGSFDDPRLETVRLAARGAASGWQTDEYFDATREMRELGERLIREGKDPGPLMTVAKMREAFAEYRDGKFEASAELHLDAARDADNVVYELKNVASAAWAFNDAFLYDRARELHERYMPIAERVGEPFLEFQLFGAERHARYRAGGTITPNDEVLSAIAEVGYGPLFSVIALQEMMASWRGGDLERALRVADSAANLWNAESQNWFVLMLFVIRSFFAGKPLSDDALDAVERCPYPRLRAQMLAFMSYLPGADGPRLRAEAKSLIPADMFEMRFEAISISECETLDQIGA